VKNREVKPETTLDELGLTSLDRLELMMAMEDRAGVPLSETAMSEARTVSDLARLTERAIETGIGPDVVSFPSWNRWRVLRLLRDVSQRTWILPLAGIFARLRVEGSEHLRGLAGPVIFAANHQSHFDTPVILKALPARWRRSVSVAMAREFFDPHFFPERHSIGQRLAAWRLACSTIWPRFSSTRFRCHGRSPVRGRRFNTLASLRQLACRS
jgi:long-chain acyl-CoA synthetase